MRKTILLFSLCLIASAAMAQFTLEQVFINVQLHRDGSATVTETRQAQIGNEGTEGYIAFNDMDDIEVRDLQVWDDQQTTYVTEDDWNIDRSRAEKAGRCGYHPTDEGVEVCWGIGDAGLRKYVIRYTLTNLVKAYDDYDGFCHSFYEAGSSPAQQALLAISLEEDTLSRANAAIWTFGYHGEKGFTDGLCYASADGAMNYGESIIVLLQLNKGVLDPAVQIHDSFTETVKRQALEGSDYDLEDAGLGKNVSIQKTRMAELSSDNEDDDEGWFGNYDIDIILLVFLVLLGVIGVAGFIIYAIIDVFLTKRRLKALFRQLFGSDDYNDLPYYRDLPLGGNLLLSGVTLGSLEGFASYIDRGSFGGTFGLQQLYDAFILRMIYKGSIRIVLSEVDGKPRKLFHISGPVQPAAGTDITDILESDGIKASAFNDNEAIDYKVTDAAMNQYKGYINDAGIEYHLQKLLYDAAGDDHLLQPDELKEYVKDNALELRPFSIMLGKLTMETMKTKEVHKDDVYQVVGFLHFLKDFSLVAEHNIEEVSLWKEYLVYASIYGIADQVRRDMKQIAPDAAKLEELMPAEELGTDYQPLSRALATTIIYAHAYQTVEEKEEIESRHSSSDSGGDSGRSSYSGGGGHSGGGGSGFR
ncbi:MAG: DUF2207 domain-containing protein [Bacteroidales bacterium]|nr:DUF2207 domain-containing protein [Bacteroidales bacterium]